MLSNIETEPKQNGVSDQCKNEQILIELKTHADQKQNSRPACQIFQLPNNQTSQRQT
jgi:hypothetical protein